jgi:putative flippase GtrA
MTDEISNKPEKQDKFFSIKTGIHFFGYSFVGGISNIIEIGLLFIFVEIFHFWYLIASLLVFTFGSVFTFIFRRFFVFKKRGFFGIRMQITSYVFIYFIGVSINFFIMAFFVEKIKTHYAIAYIISVLIVGFVGFIWNKKITFKD